MKLKTAAVDATTDDGQRLAGPFFLPLDSAAKQELRALIREYGPLEKPKGKPCEK